MRMDLLCSIALMLLGFSLQGVAAIQPESPSGLSGNVHGPKPETVFRDCASCPEMVVLPAGSFEMGSRATEPGHSSLEGPRHRVHIRRFAVGKFDVTRGQWAEFASATKRSSRSGCLWDGRTRMKPDPEGSWDNLGFPQDENHPVVCVSWSDAQDYARWLSRRTGHKYRLLTEAEWEYAARAGTDTAYPWGDTATHERANYGADKCCSGHAAGRDRWVYTSPVGSFPPNAFGLYDMHGNVLQWVQDCFSDSYAESPTDGSANVKSTVLKLSGDLADLNGTDSCAYRMLRGGDWGDIPELIRSGFRNFGPPPGASGSFVSGGVGFRIARDLD